MYVDTLIIELGPMSDRSSREFVTWLPSDLGEHLNTDKWKMILHKYSWYHIVEAIGREFGYSLQHVDMLRDTRTLIFQKAIIEGTNT